MDFSNLKIGIAITASYCTHYEVIEQIRKIKELGADIFPIISESSAQVDTRFGTSENLKKILTEITGKTPIETIKDAEPIGPKKMLDILLIAPTTGNTIAKIANGIYDTSVTVAAKAHLRNERPVVIAVSTNDALSNNAQNIGKLLNTKNIYFVPFGQDDPIKKSCSLIADFTKMSETIEKALTGKQIQPILL